MRYMYLNGIMINLGYDPHTTGQAETLASSCQESAASIAAETQTPLPSQLKTSRPPQHVQHSWCSSPFRALISCVCVCVCVHVCVCVRGMGMYMYLHVYCDQCRKTLLSRHNADNTVL